MSHFKLGNRNKWETELWMFAYMRSPCTDYEKDFGKLSLTSTVDSQDSAGNTISIFSMCNRLNLKAVLELRPVVNRLIITLYIFL